MLYLNENTIHFQRFPGKIISTISYITYIFQSIHPEETENRKVIELMKGKTRNWKGEKKILPAEVGLL